MERALIQGPTGQFGEVEHQEWLVVHDIWRIAIGEALVDAAVGQNAQLYGGTGVEIRF